MVRPSDGKEGEQRGLGLEVPLGGTGADESGRPHVLGPSGGACRERRETSDKDAAWSAPETCHLRGPAGSTTAEAGVEAGVGGACALAWGYGDWTRGVHPGRG